MRIGSIRRLQRRIRRAPPSQGIEENFLNSREAIASTDRPCRGLWRMAHGVGDELSAKPSCWHRGPAHTVTSVTLFSHLFGIRSICGPRAIAQAAHSIQSTLRRSQFRRREHSATVSGPLTLQHWLRGVARMNEPCLTLRN